jgi:hypothetical protein
MRFLDQVIGRGLCLPVFSHEILRSRGKVG